MIYIKLCVTFCDRSLAEVADYSLVILFRKSLSNSLCSARCIKNSSSSNWKDPSVRVGRILAVLITSNITMQIVRCILKLLKSISFQSHCALLKNPCGHLYIHCWIYVNGKSKVSYLGFRLKHTCFLWFLSFFFKIAPPDKNTLWKITYFLQPVFATLCYSLQFRLQTWIGGKTIQLGC